MYFLHCLHCVCKCMDLSISVNILQPVFTGYRHSVNFVRSLEPTTLKVNCIEPDRKQRGLKARLHDGVTRSAGLWLPLPDRKEIQTLTGEEITAEGKKNMFQNKRCRTSESLFAVLTIGITLSEFQSAERVILVIQSLTLLTLKSLVSFFIVANNEAFSPHSIYSVNR